MCMCTLIVLNVAININFILFSRKIVLIIGWVIFLLLAYKVSRIQLDYVEYDPYSELGIDRVSYFQLFDFEFKGLFFDFYYF